jgi:hypothetical protein
MGFYMNHHCELIEKVVQLYDFGTLNIQNQWEWFLGTYKQMQAELLKQVIRLYISSDLHIHRLLRMVIYDVERLVYDHLDKDHDIHGRIKYFEEILKQHIQANKKHHFFKTFDLPTLHDARVTRLLLSLCKSAQISGFKPHRFWISAPGNTAPAEYLELCVQV